MKDTIEVFWFSEQPYAHVTDADLEQYDSGRLGFPNTFFDPHKAHELYNQYHEQYALADEVGFDGIMSNEHHASYWCMKPAVNLDAAVISKITKNTKIAILGNVIAVNDPIRMAEEIAMLDCFSNGRIISGFVRGTAVESLTGGIIPAENRARFEEAHDLIIKCWTQPGPFRYEGNFYHYRAVNPERVIADNVRKELRKFVAGRTLDDLLNVERAALQDHIGAVFENRMDGGDGELLDAIELVKVSLLSVQPVDAAMNAFREVSSSQDDRERIIVNAQRLVVSLVPRAHGNAIYEVEQAKGEAARRTVTSAAESDAIRVVAGAVREAPEVLHNMLWREKLEASLAGRSKIIVPSEDTLSKVALWKSSNGATAAAPHH